MMSPGFTTNTRTTENPFSLLHENLAPGAARLLLLLAAGVLIFVLPVRGQQPPSLFSSTELSVAPSPANARRLALEPGAGGAYAASFAMYAALLATQTDVATSVM